MTEKPQPLPDLRAIRMVCVDVDGVLTDGQVYLGPGDLDFRGFSSQDGVALRLLRQAGVVTAVISGRASASVIRRAREVGIEHVRQGVTDKAAEFRDILALSGVAASEACFVGDDLPDLGPMRLSAFPVAVANACPEVKLCARYVTAARGGFGAVREVTELILKAQGRWSALVESLEKGRP